MQAIHNICNIMHVWAEITTTIGVHHVQNITDCIYCSVLSFVNQSHLPRSYPPYFS